MVEPGVEVRQEQMGILPGPDGSGGVWPCVTAAVFDQFSTPRHPATAAKLVCAARQGRSGWQQGARTRSWAPEGEKALNKKQKDVSSQNATHRVADR